MWEVSEKVVESSWARVPDLRKSIPVELVARRWGSQPHKMCFSAVSVNEDVITNIVKVINYKLRVCIRTYCFYLGEHLSYGKELQGIQ